MNSLEFALKLNTKELHLSACLTVEVKVCGFCRLFLRDFDVAFDLQGV